MVFCGNGGAYWQYPHLHGDRPSTCPFPESDNVIYYWKLYSLGFIPTQLPLACAEFAFTAYVIQYISKTNSMERINLSCPMDRFTKTALLLMFSIISIIAIAAYIGYQDGANMAGTDGIVEALS